MSHPTVKLSSSWSMEWCLGNRPLKAFPVDKALQAEAGLPLFKVWNESRGLTPRNWGVQCSHGRSCTSIAFLLILKAGVKIQKIQFSTQPIPGCVDIEMSTSQGKCFSLKPFKPLHKDTCLTLYVGMQQSVFLLDILEAFWHRYISLPNGKHVLCIC